MTFRPYHQEGHLYFITASISGWKRLFFNPLYANIVLGSLAFLRIKNRHFLYSFVVMPDHVHFINKPKKGFTISDVIQNFSSFTAHEILKQLRKENRRELIDFFRKEALTFQAGTPEIAGKEELTLQAGTPDIAGKRGLRRPEIAGKRKIFSSDSLYPSGRHKTRHKIWRDIQAKNIYSLSFLEQKIEYIHANPCRKKWHLVDERADYKYSSACYYDRGEKPIIEIDDVREIFQ